MNKTSGLIQTENLDATFRALKDSRSFSQTLTNLSQKSTVRDMPAEMHKRAMQKRAEFGVATAGNVSRMAPSMWAPNYQITSMILPRSLEEKNMWRRWYYAHDPIVGTALDFHTTFPISQFRLVCEDDPEGSMAEEFEEIADDIKLFDFLLKAGAEYWQVGECFPFGIWNQDELAWDAFILINPDYVDVQTNPFAQRDPVISITKWSPNLKQIVANGPNHGRTGYIYRHIQETAADLLYCITNSLPYHLSPMAVSHLARKASYFDNRGTSIIDRLFKVLIYQDKLQTAQMAGADRYATPTEVWKLGNDENPADDAAFDQLETILRSTWNSPQKAIIWDHTLEADIVSGSGAILPLPPEFEWINKEKYAALMMNESILTNNGPTYASASVAMDYMTSWYSTYRQVLEQWVARNVFEPVARARGYYKTPKREINGHYRMHRVKRRPLIPKIVWDKASLRDDYQKLETLIGLAAQSRVSWHRVYEMLNIDYDTEVDVILDEIADTQKLMAAQGGGAGAGMAMAGPGGMPMGGGGGMGELGGMPMEEGGGMPALPGGMSLSAPEMGPQSPGGNVFPPESVGAPPGAGPAGMA